MCPIHIVHRCCPKRRPLREALTSVVLWYPVQKWYFRQIRYEGFWTHWTHLPPQRRNRFSRPSLLAISFCVALGGCCLKPCDIVCDALFAFACLRCCVFACLWNQVSSFWICSIWENGTLVLLGSVSYSVSKRKPKRKPTWDGSLHFHFVQALY